MDDPGLRRFVFRVATISPVDCPLADQHAVIVQVQANLIRGGGHVLCPKAWPRGGVCLNVRVNLLDREHERMNGGIRKVGRRHGRGITGQRDHLAGVGRKITAGMWIGRQTGQRRGQANA